MQCVYLVLSANCFTKGFSISFQTATAFANSILYLQPLPHQSQVGRKIVPSSKQKYSHLRVNKSSQVGSTGTSRRMGLLGLIKYPRINLVCHMSTWDNVFQHVPKTLTQSHTKSYQARQDFSNSNMFQKHLYKVTQSPINPDQTLKAISKCP